MQKVEHQTYEIGSEIIKPIPKVHTNENILIKTIVKIKPNALLKSLPNLFLTDLKEVFSAKNGLYSITI